LGDNTLGSKTSPVSVIGGFTDWIQISSLSTHSMGLRSNGTAWAWGYNNSGQLGDNSTTSRLSPVPIVGGFTDWVQISSAGRNSIGLRSNGTAWAWGSNSNGQLGDNTTTGKSSPVSVIGGFSDWSQLSTGGYHNVGIRTNGTAWSWGANGRGRLGDGTTADKSSPVSVVGGFTDWTQVSASLSHTVAIRSNGTAWAWGGNQYYSSIYSTTIYTGNLGDGTVLDRSSPVSVIGGFTDWVQVRSGIDHSVGLRANGTAWAWGYNVFGRLGDGSTVAKSSPVSVVGGFTNWIDISPGANHVLAIRSS
jgi:alpha-tubulin suppressor-like RCC1 family protein